MKNSDELKLKRTELYEAMVALTIGDEMTEDQITEWEAKKVEVEKFDKQIEMVEKQEEINLKLAGMAIRNEDDGEKKDQFECYSEALNDFFKGKGVADDFKEFGVGGNALMIPEFLYADPLLTSTDSGLIPKSMDKRLYIRDPEAKRWLGELGAQMISPPPGTFDVPNAAAVVGGFVSEAADVSTAGLSPVTKQLKARAVGFHNSFSQEFLATANPVLQSQLIQMLVDGTWQAVALDAMLKVKQNAPGQIGTSASTAALAFKDFLNLDASVTGYRSAPKYVTTRLIKAYLQQLDIGSDGIKYAWGSDNTVAGIPTLIGDAVAANNVYYSPNWKEALAIAQWGGISLLYDPFANSESGQIKIVARSLFDSTCPNPLSVTYITDSSAGFAS